MAWPSRSRRIQSPPGPFPGKSAYNWADASLGFVKNNVSLVSQAIQGAEAFEEAATLFDSGEVGFSRWKSFEGITRVGFFTKAAGLQIGLNVAKELVTDPNDKRVLAKASATASIVLDCGGAVFATVAAWGSFGILTFVAATQWVGCLKSVTEYLTLDDQGETYFDREAVKFGMSLDAISLVGSVVSVGATTVIKAGKTVTARRFASSLIGKGAYSAGRLDRYDLYLQATGLGSKGVKYLLWPGPDGTLIPEAATPGRLDTLGGRAGLLTDPGCFLPWPIQAAGLFGPCDPLWEDQPRVGRGP